MRLKDKVAVITGAGSGMGLAMAKRFALEGAFIVANDWNADSLKTIVDVIQNDGGNIIGINGDISQENTAKLLVDEAVKSYGTLDILCNNAAVIDHAQPIATVSNDTWRRIMSINLDGPMYTMRHTTRLMLENEGGSIINISSIAGIHGAGGGVAYTAAKHGLIGLTKSTAWMYAKKGIRCNAICPGVTITNMLDEFENDKKSDAFGKERISEFAGICPAMLDPDDIASMALFLASDDSIKINGTIMTADGGWNAA